MKRIRQIATLLLTIILSISASTMDAQGRGRGQDKGDNGRGNPGRQGGQRGNDNSANRGRGNAASRNDDNNRGRNDARRDVRIVGGEVVSRPSFRMFIASDKKGRNVVGRAISQASKRGVAEDVFVTDLVGRRVHVLNNAGLLLLDVGDDDDIGSWRAVSTPFRDKDGAPNFCRSGAGHPVWGRQWCVDKGFGLGDIDNVRWTRVIDPAGVVIQRTTGDVTREVLASVLGSIVFNRLATQAITLGYLDPLTGRWLGDAAGPQILLVESGTRPLAEIVDVNRDGRADVLLVTAR